MTRILLRIAAAVALLQFLGHTVLIVSYVPKHGPEEVAVIEAMKSYHFAFQGFSRSYWEFYFGYALFAAFNSLIESILFWQLAQLVSANPGVRVRPLLTLFLFTNVAYLVLSWKYFFFTPMLFDIAIALCLAVAVIAPKVKAS